MRDTTTCVDIAPADTGQSERFLDGNWADVLIVRDGMGSPVTRWSMEGKKQWTRHCTGKWGGSQSTRFLVSASTIWPWSVGGDRGSGAKISPRFPARLSPLNCHRLPTDVTSTSSGQRGSKLQVFARIPVGGSHGDLWCVELSTAKFVKCSQYLEKALSPCWKQENLKKD